MSVSIAECRYVKSKILYLLRCCAELVISILQSNVPLEQPSPLPNTYNPPKYGRAYYLTEHGCQIRPVRWEHHTCFCEVFFIATVFTWYLGQKVEKMQQHLFTCIQLKLLLICFMISHVVFPNLIRIVNLDSSVTPGTSATYSMGLLTYAQDISIQSVAWIHQLKYKYMGAI